MSYTSQDLEMARTIGLFFWGTVVMVALIWRDASLKHHMIEAKLKDAKYSEPTRGP